MSEPSNTSAPLAKALTDGPTTRISSARKYILLSIFCFAQILDAFNNAALFPAIPTLVDSMDLKGGQIAWIVSAFQLTFASFLLINGRISDIYNPRSTQYAAENVFVAGMLFLGILPLGAGFANNKIAIIVLRACMGIPTAMTIPSAFALLVRVFPEPAEQARAIAAFGGCGAVADMLGLFIGAALVQYGSFHWVFWFAAMLATPLAVSSIFIIPPEIAKSTEVQCCTPKSKWKRLDPIGISILTAALILFIYAVTSASTDGWASAGVLAPLIISTILIPGFFYWETRIPSDEAALPPQTWFYGNFSVLFSVALLPFFWWNFLFLAFTTLWQDVFHWTTVSAAIHMIPIGVAALIMSFTGPLSRVTSPKWIILTGLSMVAMSTALLAVGGGRPDGYWFYVFPAFCIGGAGIMLIYTHTNIAILQTTPASMAGTVGAIFNGALQFGSAIGLAASSSIQTSVEAAHPDSQEYRGRAAAHWFILGIVVVEMISISYFYRTESDRETQPKLCGEVQSASVACKPGV